MAYHESAPPSKGDGESLPNYTPASLRSTGFTASRSQTASASPAYDLSEPVMLGNREGRFWLGASNLTNTFHNTSQRLRSREQNPGSYAFPASSLRRIGIGFQCDSGPGIMWYGYKTQVVVRPIACVGSALVFLTPQDWQYWKYFVVSGYGYCLSIGQPWKSSIVENVVIDAEPCPLAQLIYVSGNPVSTAQVIVITDASGASVASTTRQLSIVPIYTLTDSIGIATATFELITLQNAYGTPTATLKVELGSNGNPKATETLDQIILTDKNGAATATVIFEQLTLQDANGVPTATVILELDSTGKPTKTETLGRATLIDKQGVATATVDYELITLRDAHGTPTATVAIDVVTLRDVNGSPTATVTSTIGALPGLPDEVVLTDSKGLPIATIAATDGHLTSDGVAVTPRDSKGVATVTATGFTVYTTTLFTVQTDGPESSPYGWRKENITRDDYFHPITQAEYVAGYFIPVIIINSDIKILLPFNALTRPGGAAAIDSIVLDTGGLRGILNSWRSIQLFHDPVPILGNLLLGASTAIVALSSESFGVKLYGNCSPTNFNGCFLGLTLFSGPSRAVQALLAFMLIDLVLLCAYLRRWVSGVAGPPSSMAVLGSLLQRKATRRIFQTMKLESDNHKQSRKTLDRELEEWVFSIRHFSGVERNAHYGIIAQRCKFTETHLAARIAFLFVICGLLALILYYKSTRLDTAFELFMDSQSFGVRLIYTILGLVISFFWQFEFTWISRMEPYRRLSKRPQLANDSILMCPLTNPFVGFWQAALRGEVLTALVGFTNILSKFTPFLLSNIPFSPVQTWMLHVGTTWTVVAILASMILVLLLQILTKYPDLPVNPGNGLGDCTTSPTQKCSPIWRMPLH
ncbi:hypothetical protein F5B22DRAFT_652824 [Xylaria bambusicola]|uniref:uncharacterized protein n=1 Tax=Xylaria bambusicola TaxID=326684 RepID=UPI002008CDD0|nr:uncharacterized protein F5B22DRAFT_652824 [Xylaria bambusicola]KAI0502726.1 hypothetical protein F5B22DRAFT_652824 [Xylaria bambusicola]